jgi:porphobilinogen deaminase
MAVEIVGVTTLGDVSRSQLVQLGGTGVFVSLEGVVLGYAGLTRLGCVNAVTQVFELDEMLPAPGQGALAVECRDGEPRLAALLGAVCHLASLAAVTAERSLLEALQAGCRGGRRSVTGETL